MVLETWVTPIIVLGFNIDLANSLDLSTLRSLPPSFMLPRLLYYYAMNSMRKSTSTQLIWCIYI